MDRQQRFDFIDVCKAYARYSEATTDTFLEWVANHEALPDPHRPAAEQVAERYGFPTFVAYVFNQHRLDAERPMAHYELARAMTERTKESAWIDLVRRWHIAILREMVIPNARFLRHRAEQLITLHENNPPDTVSCWGAVRDTCMWTPLYCAAFPASTIADRLKTPYDDNELIVYDVIDQQSHGHAPEKRSKIQTELARQAFDITLREFQQLDAMPVAQRI